MRTCAWCGSVWLGRWLARAEAIRRVGARRVAETASHGICDACLAAQLEALAAARRAA
jgi:hypothetical protein